MFDLMELCACDFHCNYNINTYNNVLRNAIHVDRTRIFQNHPSNFVLVFFSVAFSTPAVLSCISQSRVFHSCILIGNFLVLHFPP